MPIAPPAPPPSSGAAGGAGGGMKSYLPLFIALNVVLIAAMGVVLYFLLRK
jgi:hypothetical protein